jgi:hypothetical protein
VVFVRLVHSKGVLPVNVDNFSLFVFNFFGSLEIEEGPLQATINYVDQRFYCKKLREVFLFEFADRRKDVLSSLDSVQHFFQVYIPFHLQTYVQQFLTFLAVFFVLFLELVVHVIVLLHNLFDEVRRSCQEHVFFLEALVDVVLDAVLDVLSFSHSLVNNLTL